jgi:hypothetical protein
MDPRDLEALGVEAYERHRLDPSTPISPAKLARLELGADSIVRAPLTTSGPARLFWHNGRRRIAVKSRLPAVYARFYVGHELAHHALERAGYVGEDLEQACDYLGAVFMAPRPAALRLHRAFGFDLGAIAKAVGSTQTWAALRLGEALVVPLVAVSPALVRVRGPEDWVWPDERTIRRAARAPTPGLRKVEITDGRGRVALVAGDDD